MYLPQCRNSPRQRSKSVLQKHPRLILNPQQCSHQRCPQVLLQRDRGEERFLEVRQEMFSVPLTQLQLSAADVKHVSCSSLHQNLGLWFVAELQSRQKKKKELVLQKKGLCSATVFRNPHIVLSGTHVVNVSVGHALSRRICSGAYLKQYEVSW